MPTYRQAHFYPAATYVGVHSKTAGQFPSESCPGDGPEGGQDVWADQFHQADQDVRLGETFPGENTQLERRGDERNKKIWSFEFNKFNIKVSYLALNF